MFDWSMKPKVKPYNYYCGSCGAKFYGKPGSDRPGCASTCGCGSSRIIRYEWATD